MTRAAKSSLVLDGNVIKMRLEAERIETKRLVHVDWLRFTALLRNAPLPNLDYVFPKSTSIWDPDYRMNRIKATLAQIPSEEFSASSQALTLADRIVEVLGEGYSINPERRKGHDFYRFRWSIERFGTECGWVGFLSSSDSPRQQAQSKTIHANLYGMACTFARPGWLSSMADLIDEIQADITRCDLALDLFEGISGGMQRVWSDYQNGLCDVAGKRLKLRDINWLKGSSRSLYLGSKEAGKETNIYEKGQQLFGDDSAHPWVRVELRYGSKLRILETDILRDPSRFFAGASPWHATILSEAGERVEPIPVKCIPALPLMTVEAEVSRVRKWVHRVASPAISFLFRYTTGDQLHSLLTNEQKPRRLERFSNEECEIAVQQLMEKLMSSESSPALV